MQCFKDVIHDVVTNDVRTAVLDLIQQEREGETVDHGLLKSVVEVRPVCPLKLNVEVGHNDCCHYRRSLWRWGWVNSRSTKVTLKLRCVPLLCLVTRRTEVVAGRPQFLEETSAFYAREAQRWVQEDGLPDYLVKVRRSRCIVSCNDWTRGTDSCHCAYRLKTA